MNLKKKHFVKSLKLLRNGRCVPVGHLEILESEWTLPSLVPVAHGFHSDDRDPQPRRHSQSER